MAHDGLYFLHILRHFLIVLIIILSSNSLSLSALFSLTYIIYWIPLLSLLMRLSVNLSGSVRLSFSYYASVTASILSHSYTTFRTLLHILFLCLSDFICVNISVSPFLVLLISLASVCIVASLYNMSTCLTFRLSFCLSFC